MEEGMCNGVSGFFSKNGNVYFIEPNDDGNISHHDVLARMPESLKNDDNLVAFEFPDWTIKSFIWDTDEVPSWVSKQKCIGIFKLVKPIWIEYNKVRAQARAEYDKVCVPAWAEYDKVCVPAWAEYNKVCVPAWAEYNKVRDQARAEYDKVCVPAWAEYDKVCVPAWAEYNKVCVPAWAEYNKVRDQAREQYNKVRAQAWTVMIKNLSEIDGYLK
jgi:hypothetical protein